MTLRKTIVVVLILALGACGLYVYSGMRREGNPAELGEAEWRRLVQRFSRRAAPERPGQPSGTAAAPARPAAPAVAPEPEPPRRPARPGPDPEQLARQREEYDARRAKSVVELQPFRTSTGARVADGEGRSGTATLSNLNPGINAWYLLRLAWEGADPIEFHLVNARPERQDLVLDEGYPAGIVIETSAGRTPCDLWSAESPLPLREAATRRTPYVMLCNEEVSVRLKTAGARTAKESTTDFLRDRIWGGERITVFVRRTFFQDAYVQASPLTEAAGPVAVENAAGAPPPARLAEEYVGRGVQTTGLGIELDAPVPGQVAVGTWYRARHVPGVYVSTIQPGLVSREILSGHRDVAAALDEVERSALAYMVAFDLDEFEVAFTLGTDHPRVDWSERTQPQARDVTLPGPDGIGTIAPLVATGIVPASVVPRTAATFTGGFKRSHGAFRSSELALRNSGTHYGFVDSGVVLSKLQPGLSTVFATGDGRLDLKTWTEEDGALLDRIRFARQNGLPIVETDPTSGEPVPGARVNRWGDGNWSGSQDKKFRTLRAGACLLEDGARRFLAYGYFSTATPSAMARVFQAYGCRYAMLLDMNALEHTYLALYYADEAGLQVEHLIGEMAVLDKRIDGTVLPRFLGFADNRDFFYLLRKPAARAPAAPAAASRPAGPTPSPAPAEARTDAQPGPASRPQAPALAERNEQLFRRLREAHGLDDARIEAVREIFARAGVLGQGNPAISVHPATPEQCREKLAGLGVRYENPAFERICGARYMAPLYDPASQRPEDAPACIDQFEFPDVPCEYPVVWVRAREAALLCEAVGKRLCDAHEWEGACAGSLQPPDYRFDLARGVDPATAIRQMRAAHNRVEDQRKVWSYGPQYRTGICAASSRKTEGCEGGGWMRCGSNTFPTGLYPECKSPLEVYDLHGNAAEHMNLPLDPSQMASRGSRELGHTEMKGSWFIFDQYKAHEDACRWRAPYWHGSRVMDRDSHHNYHLGFRCCKTIGGS